MPSRVFRKVPFNFLRKRGNKKVKAAENAVASFQESAFWMRGSYNKTVV